VGVCASGHMPWRRINTLYSGIYKNEFFSRNLGQDMPKNAYFLEKKAVKLPQWSEGGRPGGLRRLGIPPPDPSVVTPTY